MKQASDCPCPPALPLGQRRVPAEPRSPCPGRRPAASAPRSLFGRVAGLPSHGRWVHALQRQCELRRRRWGPEPGRSLVPEPPPHTDRAGGCENAAHVSTNRVRPGVLARPCTQAVPQRRLTLPGRLWGVDRREVGRRCGETIPVCRADLRPDRGRVCRRCRCCCRCCRRARSVSEGILLCYHRRMVSRLLVRACRTACRSVPRCRQCCHGRTVRRSPEVDHLRHLAARGPALLGGQTPGAARDAIRSARTGPGRTEPSAHEGASRRGRIRTCGTPSRQRFGKRACTGDGRRHEVGVRSNHVHVVVTASSGLHCAAADLKAYASRAIKRSRPGRAGSTGGARGRARVTSTARSHCSRRLNTCETRMFRIRDSSGAQRRLAAEKTDTLAHASGS